MTAPNMAASVRDRLLALARSRGWEFNRVLARYGVERVLSRLAASPHRTRFLLKGASLFTVWEGAPHRATRDLDLLGMARHALDDMGSLFREVCATPVEPDGLIFGDVTAEPIRAAKDAGGIRVMIDATLAKAIVRVQVDVGFGDVVVPAPAEIEFPTLLGMPPPRLLAYPPETVVAEKLEAMVRLGLANTRMKDFYDVWHLSRTRPFDGAILVEAIRATFKARETKIPLKPIEALTSAFWEDKTRQASWRGFLGHAGLSDEAPDLGPLIRKIGEFLRPVIAWARKSPPVMARWDPKDGSNRPR